MWATSGGCLSSLGPHPLHLSLQFLDLLHQLVHLLLVLELQVLDDLLVLVPEGEELLVPLLQLSLVLVEVDLHHLLLLCAHLQSIVYST